MAKKDNWRGTLEVKNNLLYYIPANGGDMDIDHDLKLQGSWAITKSGQLRFVVKHTQNKLFGKTITVGTELIKVNAATLEFKAAKRVTVSGKSVNTIVLNGELTAIPGHRVAFSVEREGGVDILKLDGSWDIFKNNQIGCTVKYSYENGQRTDLIILKGSWDIAGNIITYEVEKTSQPFLSREFAIKRVIFSEQEHGLDLALLAGVKRTAGRRGTRDTVSLKGVWKQNGTRAEFIFNSSRRQSVTFTLSRKLSNDRELVFELDAGEGKKPAFTVAFTKKIKGDSSFFIRGKVCGKDKRVEAGFYFPF